VDEAVTTDIVEEPLDIEEDHTDRKVRVKTKRSVSMGVHHHLGLCLIMNAGLDLTQVWQVSWGAVGMPPILAMILRVQRGETAHSSWAPAYDEQLAMLGTSWRGLVVTER